jgi:AraC-like DNA-binding protein
MKKLPSVPYHTIHESIAHTGSGNSYQEFHVFNDSEKDQIPRIPIKNDHFTIGIVTGGSLTVQLNFTNYSLTKNDLFILGPDQIHEISFISADCSFIGIHFIKEFFVNAGVHKKYIDAFTIFSSQSNPYFSLTGAEIDSLSRILLLLLEKQDSVTAHLFKNEVIHHAFSLFLFELGGIANKYRERDTIKLTRKENILVNFLRILPNHFKEERSVQFYAELLHVTPKHLSKIVKELTNKTCGELIDDQVIAEAKALLHDSSLSVANVADALHFSDQFFFSKFFKKHTGLTPTEYKNGM